MTDWAIRNNRVVVTVTLPDGGTVELTKSAALKLGREIVSAAQTAPTR